MTSAGDPDLFAIIMAGGSGTRFWPASRRARPKQFLAITGRRSMLAETWARIEPIIPAERTLVVAGAEHEALVREALPDLPPENVLLEPVGRNTLPCVALAAYEIARRAGDPVQVVLPADHLIAPAESFRASVLAAAGVARATGALVTFGIRPSYPATGYGYIEMGDPTGELAGESVHAVTRFVEKPDLARAQEFLANGRFLWNSGMFVWSTAAILDALAEHAPDVDSALRAASPADLARVYPDLPAISIDTGIMERAQVRRVLPIDYTWSDVGSWAALPGALGTDSSGHCVTGGTALLSEDARDCIVHGGEETLTALVGVEGLVVVHSNGVTLVCRKDRAEDVRAVVERLKREGPRGFA
ncbi:MAG: mannose-1-phosphate guanylyltransferase [Planctomycetota bacterium]|nr:MAG: mannose-1-phosphate guanylyltransferase [Planctomycetota bacterium]